MIWNNIPTLDILNKVNDNTLARHLGIEITGVGDDYIKAKMPVDHRTKQPMGLLHGGASVVLSETIGSIASVMIIDDMSKETIVGIEINANHLKSVSSGYVHSITKPIRIGHRIQVWNTEIYNDSDELICVSKLTTMRVEKRK